MQSSGLPALMLPFVEGAGDNEWPGRQTLGLVNHEGELHPPRWVGDWEERRPRRGAWMARKGGWRQTVVARETQQGAGWQLKTGPHPSPL